MGTNYYWLKHGEQHTCCECGNVVSNEKIHIGKSSAGWAFALHVYPSDGLHDLRHWETEWEEGGVDDRIVDEYGRQPSPAEMSRVIRERVGIRRRHDVDNVFCIGHGDGAWDRMIGEFS